MELLSKDVKCHLLSYLPNVDVCCLVLAGGTLFSTEAFSILNERLPATKAQHPLIMSVDLLRVLMLISGSDHISHRMDDIAKRAQIMYTDMRLERFDRRYKVELDRHLQGVWGYRRRKNDPTRGRISNQQWTANKCTELRDTLHRKGAPYFELLAERARLYAIKTQVGLMCNHILKPYEVLKDAKEKFEDAKETYLLWKQRYESSLESLQQAEVETQAKRRRITRT